LARSRASLEEERYKNMCDDDLVDLAKTGDELSIQILLERFRGLIKMRAKKYYAPGIDKDDLIQEGNIGFLNAIRDYRLEFKTPFRNFCDICVHRQIITAVKTATRRKHAPLNRYVPIDKPIYDEESERTLHDILENKKQQSPEEILVEHESVYEILTKLKDRLSPFEAKVLDYQILKYSYQEIGDSLNRQPKSIDNAMQRIRNKLHIITEEMRKEKERREGPASLPRKGSLAVQAEGVTKIENLG